MTPLDHYQALIKTGELEINSQQENVVKYLTQVRHHLIQRQKLHWRMFDKIARLLKLNLSPVIGLYLWGGVGGGKTMLMDFFYESLPVSKLRLHFHAFMQRLHKELQEWQGQVDPLIAIAKRLAEQYKVICFDEFLVTNVADAMLLTELFKTLFRAGICLVTTSNLPPDQLYENGLQRERFLPVIILLKRYTKVSHLLLVHDYRQRQLDQVASYFMPVDDETDQAMNHVWRHIIKNDPVTQKPLVILGREIAVIQRTDRAIWFEFSIICGRPRSSQDYLMLVEHYSVVMISNVPCLETTSKDLVVSFINLIDILYDARVRVIISAAVPIKKLYTQGGFRQGFERTESRLTEMQSKIYLTER